jgi:hypothetical protein
MGLTGEQQANKQKRVDGYHVLTVCMLLVSKVDMRVCTLSLLMGKWESPG